VLVSFLNDKDAEIQLMAVRGLAGLKGPDSDVAKTLVEFLNNRPLKKGNQELTVEVIGALGKIGGADAAAFLEGYRRIKWWKSRSLQQELRTAALRPWERSRGEGAMADARRDSRRGNPVLLREAAADQCGQNDVPASGALIKNATLYPESHPTLLASSEKFVVMVRELLAERREASFYLVRG